MRILHLTLKKQWFDMIASGEKKEEYREIKPYWETRLFGKKEYDAIEFRNGYMKDAPRIRVELKEISEGLGIIEWGAPEARPVFILKLGEILRIPTNSEVE